VADWAPQEENEQRVLVVIMNSPRDFALLQGQGWYRIPVARAPRQLAADFLAFYQTRAFPEERWTIAYYAPVKRYQIVRRVDLLPNEADHPRAGDTYYKIEVGPLHRLPKPVPSAKLRRITFIPTTLGRLLRAQDISDLWEGPPSARKLWEALQAAGIEAERGYELREGRASYRLDLAVICQRGSVGIECEAEAPPSVAGAPWPTILAARGWSLLRFGPQELDDLDACLRQVRQQVQRHGGARPVVSTLRDSRR